MKLKIIGQCFETAEKIKAIYFKHGSERLLHLDGEYIIVIENENGTEIISSYYGVSQYFYTIKNSRIFHDDTVIGVVQKAGLRWNYNFRALADITCVEHTLDVETLHPDIFRVPAATILLFSDGKLSIKTLMWDEIHQKRRSTPEDALEKFNNSVKRRLAEHIVVSMSGGFDSRVILSSLLKFDCKPQLITMGTCDSTDVVISKKISNYFGFNMEVVSLELNDYFLNGLEIVKLTGGTKTAEHWHTYIYSHKSKTIKQGAFFIGSNGEFARSNFTDYGLFAQTADIVPAISVPLLWKLRLRLIIRKEQRLFREGELSGLSKEFRNELNTDGFRRLIARLQNMVHHNFLDGFDRYYLEQRVRNFISNGIKLMSDLPIKTPFLDHDWIESIFNLPRQYKFDSKWHRFVVQKNEPRLLNFEMEKTGTCKMRPEKQRLYYLRKSNRQKSIPYADTSSFFAERKTIDFIRKHGGIIEDILSIGLLNSILEEHITNHSRTRTIGFLLAQIFWKIALFETTI